MRISIVLAALALVLAACAAGEPAAAPQEPDPAPQTTGTAAETTTTAPTTETSMHDDDGHDEMAGDMHDDDMADDMHTGDGALVVGDPSTADRVVEVVMTEFAFDPGPIEVAAGETITFEVVNEGVVVHEFRLSNEHRIEEHLEAGHADHADGGHHGTEADMVLQLEPGASGSLTATFPEDTTFFTQAACLIPGHYEAGMAVPVEYR